MADKKKKSKGLLEDKYGTDNPTVAQMVGPFVNPLIDTFKSKVSDNLVSDKLVSDKLVSPSSPLVEQLKASGYWENEDEMPTEVSGKSDLTNITKEEPEPEEEEKEKPVLDVTPKKEQKDVGIIGTSAKKADPFKDLGEYPTPDKPEETKPFEVEKEPAPEMPSMGELPTPKAVKIKLPDYKKTEGRIKSLNKTYADNVKQFNKDANEIDSDYVIAIKEAQEVYKNAKDKESSKQLWESIVHGLGHMVAGLVGMQTGTNLAGIKFDKTDWDKRKQALFGELQEAKASAYRHMGAKQRKVTERRAQAAQKHQLDVDAINRGHQAEQDNWKLQYQMENDAVKLGFQAAVAKWDRNFKAQMSVYEKDYEAKRASIDDQFKNKQISIKERDQQLERIKFDYGVKVGAYESGFKQIMAEINMRHKGKELDLKKGLQDIKKTEGNKEERKQFYTDFNDTKKLLNDAAEAKGSSQREKILGNFITGVSKTNQRAVALGIKPPFPSVEKLTKEVSGWFGNNPAGLKEMQKRSTEYNINSVLDEDDYITLPSGKRMKRN